MEDKSASINIVGAGIFGLSTAIHLATRGYQNVTVFDKQPYDKTLYSYFKGCDAASADINKIIRAAYGSQSEYQSLTLEAITEWERWNEELASGRMAVPDMTPEDQIFKNNGHLIMNEGDELPIWEQESVANMEALGHKDTQLIVSNPSHRQLAESRGLGPALDPFRKKLKSAKSTGVLDTTGGYVQADKACRFALHKARQLGVRFILDPRAGLLESLLYDESPASNERKVIGIRMADQKTHTAAITILACGGWTPSLLPELDGLCEATGGSVAFLRIPRNSPLFERFTAANFPSWQFRMRDGANGGLYGFPVDEEGWFKIGYRGTKYTNPLKQPDGKERSVPVTRWSSPRPESKSTSIPTQALRVIQRFLDDFLPELGEHGIRISSTRICWYNDSFDNHYVVDYVPNTQGLLVATAGSGHAFKLLPNIGKYVVDVMEGKNIDTLPIKAWRWRTLQKGQKPNNVLMEGSGGIRALDRVSLTSVSSQLPGGRSML